MTVTAPNYTMVICGHTDDRRNHYRGRIEKVKFGVPVSEAFACDIPATLLVLLLKVNKEGPTKKDIWRAPGNQAQVRKLTHVMQHGRLVNIANFSVYTAASVIKKFLAKLPVGIFGFDNEQRLFSLLDSDDPEKQRDAFCRVVSSLPVPSQHLLVLLFGTFRQIADQSEIAGTRMSAESIGVSVAPSLFHTCIHDGQSAKIEDVVRFRMASQIVTIIIRGFGYTNLFPRDNYEFYARITGRTLRVNENWQFTFQTPSSDLALQQEWLKSEAEKLRRTIRPRGLSSGKILDPPGQQSNCRNTGEHFRQGRRSTFVAYQSDGVIQGAFSQPEVVITPEADSPSHPGPSHGDWKPDWTRGYGSLCEVTVSMDHLKRMNHLAESTRSLTYLEWVHERQTKRMQTRSEWFLSPVIPPRNLSLKKKNGTGGQPTEFRSAESVLTPSGVQRKRSWRTHYIRPKTSDSQDSLIHLNTADSETARGQLPVTSPLRVVTVELQPPSSGRQRAPRSAGTDSSPRTGELRPKTNSTQEERRVRIGQDWTLNRRRFLAKAGVRGECWRSFECVKVRMKTH